MEIIQKGNINAIKGNIQFECERCGCIFKADKDEYETMLDCHNELIYLCNCPTCGFVVYETE